MTSIPFSNFWAPSLPLSSLLSLENHPKLTFFVSFSLPPLLTSFKDNPLLFPHSLWLESPKFKHDFVYFSICLFKANLFLGKNHTISTWIWILHVLSFPLRYLTSVLFKIFRSWFFNFKISIDCHSHAFTFSGNESLQRKLFWVSMDS